MTTHIKRKLIRFNLVNLFLHVSSWGTIDVTSEGKKIASSKWSAREPGRWRLPASSLKSKLCYDRRSAGQSFLEQSTHLGLTTRSWLLSDSCGFVDLGRPLWRGDGSVVCNCYWSSPAQSFLGPSPVGLVAIFYLRLASCISLIK
jgi:hypothetical protein